MLSDALNSEGLQDVFSDLAILFQHFLSMSALVPRIQVHVTDRDVFQPVAVGVTILRVMKRLWPGEFRWIEIPELTSCGMLHIDILAGTDELRKAIDEDGIRIR